MNNRASARLSGRSFVAPRKSSESSRLPLVRPPAPVLEARPQPQQASPTSLEFAASPEEENQVPEVPETSVTTTSFFKFPCETKGEQEPQELTRYKTLSLFRLRQQPSQAHVQRSFVVSLMALAGFVEGFCIRKHGCFPNLMTGTILKVAEAVGSWNFSGAGIHVSMIACYIAGGYFFSKWKSNNKDITKNKIEQTKCALTAVSVLSSLFLISSDLFTGIPLLKLPLLAAGFGVINSGTVDVGAGVTFALTGHVNKIGQGMATGGLAKPKDSSKTSAHRTSVQGVVAFSIAALLANLVCGVFETKASGPLRLLGKLPIGTTMLAAYSWIFHRYIKASEKVAALEGAKTA